MHENITTMLGDEQIHQIRQLAFLEIAREAVRAFSQRRQYIPAKPQIQGPI